ncbi:MAG: hypothetical protein HQL25_02475 [Candidatus Omnitrophica bacterium]|nr:hypothetical protein [Candidatus Omnitrophota bacterium]
MNVKKYNKIFITIILLGLMLVICINTIFDIYRMIGLSNWNRKFVNANYRYVKAKYLKQHHDFDAYIMGTSRSNTYNSRLASQLLGHNYYSFSVSLENIERIYEKLVWMKKQKFAVKQVILCLDYDLMFLGDDLPPDAIDMKEHPEVSGEGWFSFYPSIFLKFDFINWRKVVRENFLKKKPPAYQFDVKSGHWYYLEAEAEIAKDHEKYAKDRVENNFSGVVKGFGDRTRVNLDRFREVIKFLKNEKIEYIVVINPYYISMFQKFDREAYKKWLKDVVNISGGVWNFSGFNKVTQNKYLYYDTSHFMWSVGDQVLRRIAEGSEKQLAPDAFGDWVDEAHVEQYIRDHF